MSKRTPHQPAPPAEPTTPASPPPAPAETLEQKRERLGRELLHAPPIYRKSPLALLQRVLRDANDDEKAFITLLLNKSLSDDVQETAFSLSKKTWPGSHWLPEPWIDGADEEYQDLRRAYILLIGGGWQASFLRLILDLHTRGHLRTPDDALDAIDDLLDQFEYEIEDAAKVLREYPETLKEEIHKAIKKNPGLVA